MRIAHAARRRVAIDGQGERIHGLGQRHGRPVQRRLTHVHRNLPPRSPRTGQQAAVSTQHHRIRARLMHQTVSHATGGTAAGGQQRTVGVPEFDARGGVITIEQHGQLVETDTGVAVTELAGNFRGNRIVQAPAIDDDEIIAMGVHFHKRQRHGLSCGRPMGN